FAYTETYYDGAVGYYNAVESILKENNVTVDTTPSQQETQADTEPVTESAASDRTLPLVTDNADILTDAQEAELSVKLKELGDKYDMDAAILTVDSYEGKTDRAYADDYFIEIGYGRGESKDGFLFVFNTGKEDGTRNVYLATHGSAIEYITDFEIDVIFEMVIPDLENGEYAAAFETLTSELESAIDPSTPVYYIPLSIVIGFAIAFIIMKIQASKLKTVRKQVNAASYVANVQLTYQYDNFMYSDVSRVKRSNDSSSGGSSTHTSSSGDTFGGKGRNF
ncbi:MAG: TPM domain-containing protein, partial [Clostridia bacterium]|nr:TPM domain-containing protein [Clostridia bacterium]